MLLFLLLPLNKKILFSQFFLLLSLRVCMTWSDIRLSHWRLSCRRGNMEERHPLRLNRDSVCQVDALFMFRYQTQASDLGDGSWRVKDSECKQWLTDWLTDWLTLSLYISIFLLSRHSSSCPFPFLPLPYLALPCLFITGFRRKNTRNSWMKNGSVLIARENPIWCEFSFHPSPILERRKKIKQRNGLLIIHPPLLLLLLLLS